LKLESRDLANICSGSKHIVSAGKDQGLKRAVSFELFKRFLERCEGLGGKRVTSLRTRESDYCDGALLLQNETGIS
jgi:hypothetical protein